MVIRPLDRRVLQHTWPGNIRELRNVIQRAIVYSNSLEIDVSKKYGLIITVRQSDLHGEIA